MIVRSAPAPMKEALDLGPTIPTSRRCVGCFAPIPGRQAFWCSACRVEARRRSWRNYKRRVHGYKGVEA